MQSVTGTDATQFHFLSGGYASLYSISCICATHIQWFSTMTKGLPGRCLVVSTPLVVRSCGRTLSGEPKVLVHEELPDDRVARGEDGKANDDSERPQLRRDLLELSQSLGDGMASLVFGGDRSHQASAGAESHAGVGPERHARRRLEHPESGGGMHCDEWRGTR